MDPVILDQIPFQSDLSALMEELRVREGSSLAEKLSQLVADAQTVARPKAVYKLAMIDSTGEDHVIADGIRLTSRVLRVNLGDTHRVFAYVATCGTELEEWGHAMEGSLERYWAEVVAGAALRSAYEFLEHELLERYGIEKLADMNPGSLQDWPLNEQRPLFTLLGDPQAAIGVRLSDSLLMRPLKSVSGIYFPTQEGFASCQLCPRDDCPSRRAPYDDTLYEERYRL